MKKLILHIGFNKTGSTSIQQNLLRNAAALRTQGIFYPNDPNAPYMQRKQHLPLAAAVPQRQVRGLREGKRMTLDQAYTSLYASLEGHDFDTLLLSSESFGGIDMNPAKVAWIKEQFIDYEITIVAYIRRQDSYFPSAYQQAIKGGAIAPFDFEAHSTQLALDFAPRLAHWRQVLGPERVIVRPFVPALWPEGEIFYDFLATFGAQHGSLRVTSAANPGLDYRAVELLRSANELGLPKKRWLDICLKLKDFMPPDFEPRKMQLSSEQAETLRAYYRDSNMRALEGSGIDVDVFFPPTAPGRKACLPPKKLPPRLLLKLANGIANKHDTAPELAPKGKRPTSA